MRTFCLFLAVMLLCPFSLLAQREHVLKQIDLPHPYYYREMYLPQLTTGPSSVAWLPDAETLVYSMAGSLWKQKIGTEAAEELVAGPGYNYQPDCSPDGRWAVFAKYYKDAVELWALNLQTREAHALTRDGAVNVEPRFSPDGSHIAFVSTSFNGRFHIFEADFANGQITNVRRLTGENRSPLPRYYYSPFDTEISPTWSPDGSEIIFVSNRGHIYGSGGFWRMKAEPGAEAREIRYEETTWKARPDWSRDGKRVVYASYAGRAWHQLWLTTSVGGDPFAISYGEYDNTAPRWSPDATGIAFISNRGGNTSLWVMHVPGGDQQQVVAKMRQYLKPTGTLQIQVEDETGKPTPARVFLSGYDGRGYGPDDAWMTADDNFDRALRAEEAHYFHTSGESRITIPAGEAAVGVMKGFDYEFETRKVSITSGETAKLTVRLRRILLPEDAGHWVSGDVHVHMNYAGTYRNTPEHLVFQASAENLPIVQDLIVNKEQRIPDMAYFRTTPDPASTTSNLLLHGQEFHTSYWGHLGLLHLTDHYLLPDYAAYTNTAAASLYPANADIADMTHAQRGLVGYVHPFDELPDPTKRLTNELPVDVALGKVDYIEVLGFSDHKTTAAVWYRLLNCGFRLPAAAGTDAMANYTSLRGPVGLNRVYVQVPKGPLKVEPWLDALKRGETFTTNGPLVGFRLGGKDLGGEVKLDSGKHEVKFSAWLRSLLPIDHLQVVCNGEVVKDVPLSGDRKRADFEGTVTLNRSGWCLLRAWNEKAQDPILDLYPYATTSPVYVRIGEAPPRSPEDTKFFLAWLDRLGEAAEKNQDWNSAVEKQRVMEMLGKARKVYEGMQ